MPVVEEKVNGPSKVVYFQASPIMSTYLVAVIVGIFDYVEAFTTDGTVTSVSILPSISFFHHMMVRALNLVNLSPVSCRY
jgi:aminopeptidase N